MWNLLRSELLLSAVSTHFVHKRPQKEYDRLAQLSRIFRSFLFLQNIFCRAYRNALQASRRGVSCVMLNIESIKIL